MRQIKLYIATSLDGYIAGPNGELDWLTKYPFDSATNYGYDEFYESVDTVLLGGKTYRDVLLMSEEYVYKDKVSYIISRKEKSTLLDAEIYFIADDIIDKISKLKNEEGKDIWLVGGGELVALLMNEGLIDQMIISIVPTVIGSGIPLFPKIEKSSDWELMGNEKYSNGITQSSYQLISK